MTVFRNADAAYAPIVSFVMHGESPADTKKASVCMLAGGRFAAGMAAGFFHRGKAAVDAD